MSRAGQYDIARAKEYTLAHPDHSKAQAAVALGVSTTTVARARAELVDEGHRPPSRKRAPTPSSERPAVAPPSADVGPVSVPPVAPPQAATMLDHAALAAMAEMTDADLDLDDEEVRRRLLRQCLRFAFDPKLHPDTRMSASQMWAKLKEQTSARSLGPDRRAMTFDMAVGYVADILIAVGPGVTVAAVNKAFDVKGAPDAAQAEQAAPADGTPSAPSTT